MELGEIRKRIDKIDRDIVGLLEERMELAVRSEKFKDEVDDPKREAEVMQRLEALSCDLVEAEFRKRLLRSIIDEGKRLQKDHGKLAAFQGEHGAFSEKATRQVFGTSVKTLPCASFRDVFDAVVSGKAQYGVLPVENTLAGSVHQNYDLLLEYDVQIIGESASWKQSTTDSKK